MSILKNKRGFTLLELLLVIVVMVAMAVAGIHLSEIKAEHAQVDHTALTMQQLLESATSYYIQQYNATSQGQNTGSWPTAISDLITAGLLPASFVNKNSWGEPYNITSSATANMFTLQTDVPSQALAMLLSSRMPIATTEQSDKNYSVTASISIPSYNYNNARAVNDVNYVNPGQCIKEPICPNNMQPSVTLAPVGVYGFSGNNNTVDMQGFTLYKGDGNGDDAAACNSADIDPSYTLPTCDSGYIRACLHVSADTSTGGVAITQTMASYLYIMALGQCVPSTPAPPEIF